MWINIAGFLFSLVFYASVLFRTSENAIPAHTSLQDTLLVVDCKVKSQLFDLGKKQDSLARLLQAQKAVVIAREGKIMKAREKIQLVLQSDWDSIAPVQRELYTAELIKRLKKRQ
jgi:hypothetical protein